jgi:hypothetical protein
VPKVIVLVPGAQHSASGVSEAVAAGAARVRFTEVEVRAVSHDPTTSRGIRVLDAINELRTYDAVIVAASAQPGEESTLLDVLETAERTLPKDAFLNTVLAVAGASDALLARAARLGGILVSVPRRSDDPAQQAGDLGERVATVVEWVRHARSHEHGHSHSHSHSHSHHQH